ncbi:hypothetical protein AAP_00063 [Ascosphaera apis ARSEF 7405]|uniref:Uncharacterized protein n=1 Tax=Ascosphaera apis ARSEF 7405 TaxID=392613 RepID=A0A162ISF7_9EURO|nr:hypothetical protein AAP_00063 [Ascosphaera apis ARSEF 7405]
MSRRTIGRPRDLIRLGILGPIGQHPLNTTTSINKREYLARRPRKRRGVIATRRIIQSSEPVVPEPLPEPNYGLPPEPEPEYEPLILEPGYYSSDEGADANRPPAFEAGDEYWEEQNADLDSEAELGLERPENVRIAIDKAMDELAMNDEREPGEDEADDTGETEAENHEATNDHESSYDMGKVVSPSYDEVSQIDQFVLGMALFAYQASLSRTMWDSLFELLQTVKDVQQLRSLPKSLTTLKKACFRTVKVIPVCTKEIPVVHAKMPSLSAQERVQLLKLTRPIFYIDPVANLINHLKDADFAKINHVGIAEFVDCPKEMWQTHAWASSARTSCGDLTCYRNTTDKIIPSDIVEYECQQTSCVCARSGNHIGRIIEIGTKDGVRCVKLHPMLTVESPWVIGSGDIVLEQSELVPDAGKPMLVKEQEIVRRRSDIALIWSDQDPIPPHNLYIRRVYRLKFNGEYELVPLMKTNMLRAELEARAFGGREQLLQLLSPKARRVICLPIMIFIDGFGLYRTMHRSLIGVHDARRRNEYIYTLAFGPHGTNYPDVIAAITPGLAALDGGYDTCVGGEKVRLFSYPICFLGDMPQQNENAGIAHPTGRVSCRFCMATQDDRGNLAYDTMQNKRHLREIEDAWHEIENVEEQNKKEEIRKRFGFSMEPTPLTKISRAMDITRDMPSDPCHSELAGMMKIAVNVLLGDIFTPTGKTKFSNILREFPMPQGWQKLQSPLHYLDSYQIQEFARIGTLIPVIFRLYLEPCWLQLRVREAIPFFFNREVDRGGGGTAEKLLTGVFAKMALSNRVLISWADEGSDNHFVGKAVQNAREALQTLLRSVAMSANTSNAMTGSRYSSLALTQCQTPRRGRKVKRADEVLRMMQRPNMHIGLHYKEMVEEWGCANNGNVLMGENKHRLFKSLVTHTNHRDPEKSLLIRESLDKTISAYLSSSPEAEDDTVSKLQQLQRKCPTLMSRFGHKSDTIDNSSWRVHARETSHQVSRRIGLESGKLTMLGATCPFITKLRLAHMLDYHDNSIPARVTEPLVFYKTAVISIKRPCALQSRLWSCHIYLCAPIVKHTRPSSVFVNYPDEDKKAGRGAGV